MDHRSIYYISAAVPILLVLASAVALYVDYQNTQVERRILAKVDGTLTQHRIETAKANDSRASVFLAQQATIQDLTNQRIERNKAEIADLAARLDQIVREK